jgi:DNA-binding CsgD family transcriptional regulator
LTEVLTLISRMAETKRIEKVWGFAVSHFRTLGFSRVNYGLTRFLYANNVGDPDDAVFLSTADPEYVRMYFRGGFYARTPVYRWAIQNEGACTWEWVEKAYHEKRLTAEEMEAVRINIQMGVVAGIGVSFPVTSTRSKGALGLIADKGMSHADVERIFAEKRSEIMAIAHMMHLKIAQLPGAVGRRALTARQREALEWVADGKTMQDVAIRIGVSPAMVEKHLRLAREALDVETTAQAVAKSALMNIIFQRDPTTVVPQDMTVR